MGGWRGASAQGADGGCVDGRGLSEQLVTLFTGFPIDSACGKLVEKVINMNTEHYDCHNCKLAA